MKVLVLAELDKLNSFKQSLQHILNQQEIETVFSLSKFWDADNDFDIVFFHWEEYLVKTHHPDEQFLDKLEKRLLYWKSKSKLVLLKHNLKTHKAFQNDDKIFELVNKYQDGIIHMGEFSKREYFRMYDFAKSKQHIVIPHQWYPEVPNNSDRNQARRHFNIKENQFVVLVFGAIRNQLECDLILDAFEELNCENKVLLVSNWRGEKSVSKRNNPFKWIKLKLKSLIYDLNPKFKFNQEFVDESEIHYFFNASDILLIPRTDTLNSGNVPLGFTFRKVVVGADVGNMGEIFKKTGNPVFNMKDKKSIAEAMNEAFLLANRGKGEENYNYASTNWNYEKIGLLYKTFFESIIELKLSK